MNYHVSFLESLEPFEAEIRTKIIPNSVFRLARPKKKVPVVFIVDCHGIAAFRAFLQKSRLFSGFLRDDSSSIHSNTADFNYSLHLIYEAKNQNQVLFMNELRDGFKNGWMDSCLFAYSSPQKSASKSTSGFFSFFSTGSDKSSSRSRESTANDWKSYYGVSAGSLIETTLRDRFLGYIRDEKSVVYVSGSDQLGNIVSKSLINIMKSNGINGVRTLVNMRKVRRFIEDTN